MLKRKGLLLCAPLVLLCYSLFSQSQGQPSLTISREKTLDAIEKRLEDLRGLSEKDKKTIQDLKRLTKTYEEILILYKEISKNDKESLRIYKSLLKDYEERINKDKWVIGSVSAVAGIAILTSIVLTSLKFYAKN